MRGSVTSRDKTKRKTTDIADIGADQPVWNGVFS